MAGPVRKSVRPDPPRPAWLRFQPGGWVAVEVYEWQLRDDGWWAEVEDASNGNPAQMVWVRSEELHSRYPIHVGRVHRCADPP